MAFIGTIEFNFVAFVPSDNEDMRAYWPEVWVDMSQVEFAVQPLILKILSLVYEKSLKNGAMYALAVG